MSIIGSNALAGASGQSTGGGGGGGGGATTQIDRSLRFVSADSAYLSRTPTSAGNRKTWTWSAWIKRATIGTSQRIFTGATSAADADWTAIHFVSDKLFISGYNTHYRYSNRLFRDPGAWFHLVVKYDLDASTEAEKIKAWYNGEVITWESSTAAPATSGINAANNHTLGAEQAPNNGGLNSYCDLYLAEVHFVDGQALAASDFGQYDSNNVWQPKDFTGSYGWFDQSQTWSGLWSTTGTTYGSAAALHDATVSTASYFQIDNSGTFTLSSALPVTSLRFYTQVFGTGGTVSVNGTDVTSQLQSSGIAWSEITGFTSLSTISVTGNNDGNNLIGWYAIELNGKLLIDSGITGIADNSFHLDFSDNSSDAALGTDSSGNSNDWTVNNLSADGPGVTTTGNISLNSTNRSFYFKGTSGQSIGVSSGNHVWDSSDGISWTYRGTSSTSVSLTAAYIYISGTTDITFTNSSSASVKYWDLALGTGIANTSGTTATFNLEAYGAEGIDSLIDTPTNYSVESGNEGGNYCTLNPLINVGQTLKQGNLVCSGVSGRAAGTIYVSSGKWYFEFKAGSDYTMVGIESSSAPPNPAWPGDNDQQHALYANAGSGGMWSNNSSTSYPGFVANDLIGVALDMDGGKLYYYKNGSALNSGVAAVTGLTGAWTATCRSGSGASDGDTIFNFGQRPFVYPPGGTGAPSSEYKSWCTQNISAPTITDGSTAMDATIWSGDGVSGRDITGLSHGPDLVWIKRRNSSSDWNILFDSIRGGEQLSSNEDDEGLAQGSNVAGYVSAYNSDGFELTQGSNLNSVNATGGTYVGWTWDGGDLATTSDTTSYDQSQVWSDSVTNPNGAYGVASNAFNGDLSTHASPNSSNPMTYTNPSASDTVISTFRIYTAIYTTSGITLELNDTDISDQVTTTTGWQTITGFTNQNFSKLKWAANSSNYEVQLRAVEVNGKILLDRGVIPVGGENSTAYNQSQVWSTYGTFTGSYSGSYDWAGVFAASNTYDAAGSLYLTSGTGKWTLTSSLACSSEIKIYVNGASSFTINEGLSDEKTVATTSSGFHYVVIPFSGNISSIKLNTAAQYTIRIYVDGAALIDQGITLGGTGVPNVPTLASTVRANPTAGFSIVQYVSGGSGGRIATGLNATPDIVFFKPTSSAGDWFVYTDVIDGSLDYLKLNAIDTKNDSAWTQLLSISNFITMEGSSAAINSSGVTYIAYCFTSIEGYSKISTYTANAFDNGPFVYTGFRPKWIMIKHATGTATNYSSWLIVDTERDTYNVSDAGLLANMSAIEGTRGDGTGTAGPWVDILSNGFKIRYSWQVVNGTSGDKYLYMAFAENPFSLNGGLAR